MSSLRSRSTAATASRVAAALGLDPAGVLDLSASMNPVAPDPVPVLARHLDATRPLPGSATGDRGAGRDARGRRTTACCSPTAAPRPSPSSPPSCGRGGSTSRTSASTGATWRASIDGGPRFRSNPHNPTGVLAAPDDRAGVWDEAFYPLATGRWTRGDVDRGSVVVGSLTKVLACPGLRLGLRAGARPGAGRPAGAPPAELVGQRARSSSASGPPCAGRSPGVGEVHRRAASPARRPPGATRPASPTRGRQLRAGGRSRRAAIATGAARCGRARLHELRAARPRSRRRPRRRWAAPP